MSEITNNSGNHTFSAVAVLGVTSNDREYIELVEIGQVVSGDRLLNGFSVIAKDAFVVFSVDLFQIIQVDTG